MFCNLVRPSNLSVLHCLSSTARPIKMRALKRDYGCKSEVFQVGKLMFFFLIFLTLFKHGTATSDPIDEDKEYEELKYERYHWFTIGEGNSCPTSFLSDLKRNSAPGAQKVIKLGKAALRLLFNETPIPDPEDVLPFELLHVLSEEDEKNLTNTLPQHEKDRNQRLRPKIDQWKKDKVEREKKRVDKLNSMFCTKHCHPFLKLHKIKCLDFDYL